MFTNLSKTAIQFVSVGFIHRYQISVQVLCKPVKRTRLMMVVIWFMKVLLVSFPWILLTLPPCPWSVLNVFTGNADINVLLSAAVFFVEEINSLALSYFFNSWSGLLILMLSYSNFSWTSVAICFSQENVNVQKCVVFLMAQWFLLDMY